MVAMSRAKVKYSPGMNSWELSDETQQGRGSQWEDSNLVPAN